MVSAFYFVAFLAALAMTAANVLRNKKANSLFVLMSVFVTINFLGRYLISVSQTTEQAVWAHKFMYVGAGFTVPVLLMVGVEMCGFIMSMLLGTLLFGMVAVIYGFVLTIGYSYIYYKSGTAEATPNGFRAEEIPVEARIMALADVLDALCEQAQEAYSCDRAFSIIENDLGTHFDPVPGKLFLERREELEQLYDNS